MEVVSQLDALRSLDVNKIFNAIPYQSSVALADLRQLLEYHKKQELKLLAKQFENVLQDRQEKLFASNQQMLDSWHSKQEKLLAKIKDNVQSVCSTIANHLDVPDTRFSAFKKQIVNSIVGAGIHDETIALEHNLRIMVSFNDSVVLRDIVENSDENNNTSWICKYIKIDYKLSDGTAVIEDDYVTTYVSIDYVKQKLTKIISSMFTSI